MKLLIVEDEPSLREIMVQTLRREQYVVEQAADYASGLDKIAAYDYDCILLDIMLPDGNGLKLLEALRQRQQRAGVIIISARDSLDDKIGGLELGADDYLPKPFHLAELSARIRSVLRRHQRNGQASLEASGTEGSATDEQMYFATSKDGLSWHDTRESGDPVLSWNNSQTGNSRGKDNGVRDPYLVRSPEGDTVYLIATELSIHNRGGWGAATATTNGSTNLIVWESHDFVNWSEPRAVDVASQIPGAGMAWAPEAYWDDVNKQYMVYWATASDADNKSGDRTNMYYSTTRDFGPVRRPAAAAGTGPRTAA